MIRTPAEIERPPASHAARSRSRRIRRVLTWTVGPILLAVTVRALFRFPWHETARALLHARVGLLALAAAVNLVSLALKGWGWHLLLRRLVPARFWTAQAGTTIGCAVGSVSVSGIGEGARVRFVSSRDHVPEGRVVATLVWTRVAEAIGLAVLVLVVPFWLTLPWHVHALQAVACAALLTFVLVPRLRVWARAAALLPVRVRRWGAGFRTLGSGTVLIAPSALALGSWCAQWATYHLAARAVGIPVSFAASFAALLAVNVAGIPRLTPANAGVTQAAIVVALLPFGVAPERAVAAGVALQALQVVPVLVLGAACGGLAFLRRDRSVPAASHGPAAA